MPMRHGYSKIEGKMDKLGTLEKPDTGPAAPDGSFVNSMRAKKGGFTPMQKLPKFRKSAAVKSK